jgi:hypothetical protein
MGRKKRSHLQQFSKFCFQKPKNPLTKRKDPLSEQRAPLSERRAPLSTRKLRCAAGAPCAYCAQSTEICQFAKDVKPRYQTIREVFFSFCQKILGCQTHMPNNLLAKLFDEGIVNN